MTPREFANRICRNVWDWDYEAFCRRTGMPPATPEAQELWQAFKDAGRALGRFDDRLLEVITAPATKETT